jgi:hypothetical protein
LEVRKAEKMSIPKDAYQILESIVGAGYVTDDPVIGETYMRGGFLIDTPLEKVATRPGCVILPKSTSEVQEIIKLCNRYKLPFVPASSFWSQNCAAKDTNFVLFDLKRMNQLEIDEQNMYAVVEPGVIYSQLQAEAMKRSLYTLSPGGGAQASVLANHICYSFSPLCYRIGMPSRRILGLEWILANGEMVRLGSLAEQDDPFWGEGPGPDLRGILRGTSGWEGHAGIVTKIAVKLFPFISPEKLEPEGISPETTLRLPLNRMRWYNINMPDDETLFRAMREIGQSEIATAIMKVPTLWRYRGRAKSKEEFWKIWRHDADEIRRNPPHILRVLLTGYTSEEQLLYEEKVLNDIITELGGEFRRTRPTDASWFQSADSVAMWWSTGAYATVDGTIESAKHAITRGETLVRIKEESFTPPLVDEYGEKGWIQVTDFGHLTYLEFLAQWNPYEIGADMSFTEFWVASQRAAVDEEHYTIMSLAPSTILKLTGPNYGPNYHLWMEKIRKMLDPNNLSNPPFDIFDRLVDEQAPQLKEKYHFG